MTGHYPPLTTSNCGNSRGAYPGTVYKTWLAAATLRLLAVSLPGDAARPCPSAGLQASC
jgi:hypothetical protein